jgi:putative spermidine/putrescine transport system permease protein
MLFRVGGVLRRTGLAVSPAEAGIAEDGADPARRSRAFLRRNAWLLGALVPVAVVAVFFAYPVLEIFRRSFTEFVGAGDSGFANYSWYFGDAAQRTILVRTFTTALAVTAVCLAVGYPYAYLMTIVNPRWRLVMLAVVLMPFWTSLIVRTYAWIILFQDTGPIVSVLRDLGFDDVELLGTTLAVGIGMAQLMLPFMVLPLYSALVSIDRRLLLAAQGLGARPSAAFARIYLPLSLPGIVAGSSAVFILSLGFYFTPALLGSPQNSLISQQIVIQIERLLAFGRGGAMAVVLLAITLLLLAIGSLAARRWTRALTAQSTSRTT